ncbi:hypothetical protein GO755_07725 [Spirosoma sp. HMF4905]|uniref:Uncharacterized protein n=1 Tax=Spirosoma arboris TaxID=2682092 RepID=A0A7K1S7Y6_9BACT|nr:hypothetical protein [Spirosoma arboris]MVM29917.1 hypothetical protein [Spirosoma arboris]
MHKIDLAIYPIGMAALLELIHLPSDYSTREALNRLSLAEIALVEWRGRVTPQTLLTWKLRDRRKKYCLKLPLSVAVALRIVLKRLHLENELQEVYNELDRALVNSGLSPKFLTYSL